jgi:hypothetical protein
LKTVYLFGFFDGFDYRPHVATVFAVHVAYAGSSCVVVATTLLLALGLHVAIEAPSLTIRRLALKKLPF